MPGRSVRARMKVRRSYVVFSLARHALIDRFLCSGPRGARLQHIGKRRFGRAQTGRVLIRLANVQVMVFDGVHDYAHGLNVQTGLVER